MTTKITEAMASFKEAITATVKLASNQFDSWCEPEQDQVDKDDINAMQIKLMIWQRKNFGDVSPIDKVDVHMTLGVIEEFAEALTADELHGGKGKLDGLGDTCVYQGQLLINNRLCIAPVMELADLIIDSDALFESDHIELAGSFTHWVLKHEQKIRELAKSHDPAAAKQTWLEGLVWHLACILAQTKADICWYAMQNSEDTIKAKGLIQRTYIDVGQNVVLKRNWTADKVSGGEQTPA